MNEKDLDEDDLLGALEEAEKGLIEIENDDDEQVPDLGIGERDLHSPTLPICVAKGREEDKDDERKRRS